MIEAKQALLGALSEAIQEVSPGATVPAAFESPKQAAHGDLAVTAAMQLAKPLKKNPREVAQALIDALKRRPAAQHLAGIEIAGPGFINLRLTPAAKQTVVAEVLRAGDRFGRQPEHDGHVLVEFVSANPTGPMHLGHARQAALGDAICNLFETQGWKVTREFYYNDSGVQIATLAASVQARIRGLKPGDPGWPDVAYNGDYIADIAADFMAKKTVRADDRTFTASGDPNDIDGIRQFAVARVRAGLQAAGVGVPAGYPDYVLHKMVTVMKGGEEVKISKRAGSYVTLRDLIDWTSRDAVRFFLLSRKGDTEFVFDVDLALAQNNENPVYYVQYAHARICSVLRLWADEHGGKAATLASADLSLLTEPTELSLMLDLAEYPALLAKAAAELAPHDVAFYTRRLAGDYHSYYDKVRFLVDGNPELTRDRLALLAATKQVIQNAL